MMVVSTRAGNIESGVLSEANKIDWSILHLDNRIVSVEMRFQRKYRDLTIVFLAFFQFFSCQTDLHRHERLHGFFFIVLTSHKLLLRRMTIGKIQWESDFGMKTDISLLTSDSSAWQTQPCHERFLDFCSLCQVSKQDVQMVALGCEDRKVSVGI